MKTRHTQFLAAVLACASALTAVTASNAQNGTIGGVSKSDVAWIGVAIGAVGVGIGVGIYFAVAHNHNLTGCAVSGAAGLELQNKGDMQAYSLVGAVSDIKPGERVRVSGKKVKKPAGAPPQFLVSRVAKDFGPCAAHAAKS